MSTIRKMMIAIFLLVGTYSFSNSVGSSSNSHIQPATVWESIVGQAKEEHQLQLENQAWEIAMLDLILDYVPDRFRSTFIAYSSSPKMKRLRLWYLAMAWQESGWIHMKSGRNKNGTRDYGPMGWNSANAKDPTMVVFEPSPEDERYDRYIGDDYYKHVMVAGMNFITALWYEKVKGRERGSNALFIYNCGLPTYNKGPDAIPDSTYSYVKLIKGFHEDYLAQYTNYYRIRLAQLQEQENQATYNGFPLDLLQEPKRNRELIGYMLNKALEKGKDAGPTNRIQYYGMVTIPAMYPDYLEDGFEGSIIHGPIWEYLILTEADELV